MSETAARRSAIPRVSLARVRRVPKPLALLLVLALVEVFAWTLASPAFQGPDEIAHYAYVQNLAENGKKPQYDTGSGTESTIEGSAVYYLDLRALAGNSGSRPLWSPADKKGWEEVERGIAASGWKNAGGPNAIAKNPPLYYAYEAIPYKLFRGSSFFTQVFWMRIANGLLFVLTVLFTWLLASELFSRVWLRVLATSAVALQPTLSYTSSIINPDTQLATLFAAFAFIAVRTVLRGPSAKRLIALGLVVVAALLTHGRGLAVLPPALIALALAYDRHRPQHRKLIRIGSVAAALVLLFVVWEATAGHGLLGPYGGEINIPPEARHPTQFASFVWQFYFPRLPFMAPRFGPNYGFNQMFIVGLFGGRFGSLETVFSQNVYDLIELFIISGVVLLVAAAVARWNELRVRWDVAFLLTCTAASLTLFLHFVSYRALSTEVQKVDPLIVGRYLLPLIPIYGVAVAALVGSARKWSLQIGGAVLGLFLAHQLGALGLVLARFYG